MHRALEVLETAWTALTRVAIVVVIVAVGWVAYRDIVGDTVSLEPISVPKDLAEKGLTPEIVATDIRVSLVRFVNQSTTTMHRTSVRMNNPVASAAPDIVVPGTGFSVGSMTTWINARLLSSGLRSRLHLPERRIVTGEIIRPDKNYVLCLRLNDEVIYQTGTPVAIEAIDSEIEKASEAVAKRTMPYMYASYLFDSGHGDATKQAALASLLHWIIETRPDEDESVARAVNLLGLLLENSDDDEAAKVHFGHANTLAERAGIDHFEAAYVNLALVTLASARAADQAASKAGNPKQADVRNAVTRDLIVLARRYANNAIARAPSVSQPYFALSEIDAFQAHLATESGDTETADAYVLATKRDYDAAIAVAPDDPFAYWGRANLLAANSRMHDIAQAVADRYQALNLARKSPQDIHASPADYLMLAADLVSENSEVSAGRLDDHWTPDISDQDRIAALAKFEAASAGAVLPREVAEPPADPTALADWRLQRRHALLVEACDALLSAARLVPSGEDEDGTKRLIATASEGWDKASAQLGATMPACYIATSK